MSESIHPPRKHWFWEIFSGLALLAVVGICAALNYQSQKRTERMMAAIDWYDTRKITRLLREGANPSTRSGGGKTVLMIAAELGDLALLNTLLATGVDVNAPADDGLTALHFAIHPDAKLQFLQRLLDHGASPTAATSRGHTPLHYSVTASHVVGMKLLLRAGADINVRDDRGETPLHWAINQRDQKCLHVLLTAGADAALQNTQGLTVLDLARKTREDDLRNYAPLLAGGKMRPDNLAPARIVRILETRER
jgi:ankyrin repeat protein